MKPCHSNQIKTEGAQLKISFTHTDSTLNVDQKLSKNSAGAGDLMLSLKELLQLKFQKK